jgi:hypothetical protein
VRRRSGTLAAAHRSPLARLRDLAALGRAATANRARIESWKTRLGSDRKATVRSDRIISAERAVVLVGQDSVSASSGTAVRGSSIESTAHSANAPIAYGAVWTIDASNV